jgi:hypothetical protein
MVRSVARMTRAMRGPSIISETLPIYIRGAFFDSANANVTVPVDL